MRFQAPLCVKEGEEITNKRRAIIKMGKGSAAHVMEDNKG